MSHVRNYIFKINSSYMACNSCVDLTKENDLLRAQLDVLQRELSELYSDTVDNDDDISEVNERKTRKSMFAKKIMRLSMIQDVEKIISDELVYLGEDVDIKCVCGKITDIAHMYYNCVTENIIPIGDKCARNNGLNIVTYDISKIIKSFPLKHTSIESLQKYKSDIKNDIVCYVTTNKDFEPVELFHIRKMIPFIMNICPENKEVLNVTLNKLTIKERQIKMDPKRTCVCDILDVCCCENPTIKSSFCNEDNKSYMKCEQCDRWMCRGCDYDSYLSPYDQLI